MDKFTSRLRDDASRIDAEISAQLDSRIRASLNATGPEAAQRRQPARRPVSFWLASSVTGSESRQVIHNDWDLFRETYTAGTFHGFRGTGINAIQSRPEEH